MCLARHINAKHATNATTANPHGGGDDDGGGGRTIVASRRCRLLFDAGKHTADGGGGRRVWPRVNLLLPRFSPPPHLPSRLSRPRVGEGRRLGDPQLLRTASRRVRARALLFLHRNAREIPTAHCNNVNAKRRRMGQTFVRMYDRMVGERRWEGRRGGKGAPSS